MHKTNSQYSLAYAMSTDARRTKKRTPLLMTLTLLMSVITRLLLIKWMAAAVLM